MNWLLRFHSIVIRLAFPLWYGWRPYGRYAAYLKQSQWWSWPRIQEFQSQKLQKLLAHAYTKVPYYRQRFQQAGITPGNARVTSDVLQLLPVLTKHDIQEYQNDLLSNGCDRRKLIRNHTGGSTGQPLTFFQDRNFMNWSKADLLRNYEMTGYRLGMRWAFLWGSDYDAEDHRGWKGWIKDRVIFNTLWINTFSLSKNLLERTASTLIHWQPQVMVAYVSSAVLLARLVQEKNIKGINLKAIQLSAETLTPEDRTLVSEVFKCPVFNRYGCREVGNIAHECEQHNGLHVLAENNMIELLDDGGNPVQPGKPGRVIVTNLNNYAMPLIRYDTGDVAVASDRFCPCGRGLPLIDAILGRKTDFISSPSGKLIYGEFFTHLFYNVRGVYQFRVVQETLTDLTLQIVPGPDFDQQTALKFLEDIIHEHGDKEFRVRFEIAGTIPPSPSGKYRFTISKVPLQL